MRQFPHPSSASCEALGGPRLVVCRLGRPPPWRGAHYGSARPPLEGVCDVIFTLCAKCLMGQAFVAFPPAVGISRRAGGRGRSCACPPATRLRSRAAAAAAARLRRRVAGGQAQLRPRPPARRLMPTAGGKATKACPIRHLAHKVKITSQTPSKGGRALP